MDIFDIIGPIMVGPSSSHTAGAVRIGNMARKVLGEDPEEVKVFFHGSFAKTYQGHGSDKAVIGGLLGFETDDPRIVDSLEIASEKGMVYSFDTIQIDDTHPNTILIEVRGKGGDIISIQGASVGGGNIIIQKLDDIEVEFNGVYSTLIIEHIDAPGVIAHITNYLASRDINIGNMKVFRSKKGGRSLMIIEIDGDLPTHIDEDIEKIRLVINSRSIEKF